MTNQQHPITPSPELVRKWAEECPPYNVPADHIATQAAQWGADQELEACVKWIEDCGYHPSVSEDFRAARRPKPPSLKEEVRQIIDCLIEGDCLNDDDAVTMLRVLEVLPND